MRENQSTWPLHEVGNGPNGAKALVVEFFDVHKQDQRPATRLASVR